MQSIYNFNKNLEKIIAKFAILKKGFGPVM